jgi:GntR family transcriptional regulator
MNSFLLPDITLDVSSGMPLYLQLVSVIRGAVEDGRLRPGDVLPAERVLVDRLGIARGTVRKALQQLLEEGVIVRNQGSGTFIAPRVRPSLSLLESFSEMADASGGKAQSELVGFQCRPATRKEAEVLHLTEEGSLVVEIDRLRKINGIAVSLQSAVLPYSLLGSIHSLGESLYEYLEEKGAPVIRANQHFSAVLPEGRVSHWLNISESTPLLLVTRTGFTHDDRPVEYARTWCLDEFCDFTIELRRDNAGA